MERRDLLKMIAAATGMAFVGAEAWAAGGASSAASEASVDFSSKDVQLLDEIAETILPATQTPGAKAAGCGAVMATFIRDCYEPAQQQLVKAGLVDIRALAKHQFNNDFLALTAAQKLTLLQALDTASKNASSGGSGNSSLSGSRQKQRDGAPHYFVLLKQLSIFTFFTSKVGGTQVLRYQAVPGHYNGDLPYKKGDRAWATGG